MRRIYGPTVLSLFLVATSGCGGCDPIGADAGSPEPAPGVEPDDGGTPGPGADGGGPEADGGEPDTDGGGEPDTPPPDGGAEPDPLIIPINDFCEGSGSVSSQGECAGDVAEDTFRAAVCACDGIEVGSQLSVDSFNSAAGPYNEATAGDDGNVGVNTQPYIPGGKTQLSGSLSVGGNGAEFGPDSFVEGNLIVNGPLTAAANTSGRIGRNAFVNGDVAADYLVEGNLVAAPGSTIDATVTGTTTFQAIPAPVPCACDPTEILDIAGFTNFGEQTNDNAVYGSVDGGPATPLAPDAFAGGGDGTLELPCGRYYLSSIQTGALTVDVQGRAVLFVDGNFQTSGLDIQLNGEDAELDLFVAGNLTIDSNASFGDPARPAQVRVYVAGDVSIQAAATFAGNLYAPQANVSMNASADVYGSLFVNRVVFNGNSSVHFDSAIREAGDACIEDPDPVDGGPGPVDGGPVDGGVLPPVDAGPELDAGTPPPVDAGPPAGCDDICNNDCPETQSCQVDTGVCGECRSDLDCCFPTLCGTNGQCFYIGG